MVTMPENEVEGPAVVERYGSKGDKAKEHQGEPEIVSISSNSVA
jgi:hypothetical protein